MSRARDFADLAGSADAGGLTGRNLIINGAMTVDQRNATTTATGYTLDRFRIVKSTSFDELVIAVTQDADNPSGNGFANSLKLAVTTAESAIASDELMYLQHGLEGQDIHHVAYGTSSAKSLTLSFWVKSPLAGKHAVTFYQQTPARSNLQSYTVSSANTWEHKTITIDGDTSGNIVNDNSHEFTIFWPLAGGSDYHGTPHTGWGAYSATDDFMFSDQVNLAGQTGNFYLTGIQLEVGEQATPFEHRSFHDELRRCKRYFERFAKTLTSVGQASEANCGLWSGMSRSGNSGNNQGVMTYQTKRTNPSISVSSAAHINGVFPISPFAASLSSFGIDGNAGIDNCFVNAANNASTAPSSDCGSSGVMGDSSGTLDIDAEL